MRVEPAPRYGLILVVWAIIAGAVVTACSPVILALCLIWGAR
jgi:hypothetical protein